MQLQRKRANLCLTNLNDDCLLLICQKLTLKDQFVLLQLNEHFQALILQIWQRKYGKSFNCCQEHCQLSQLQDEEQAELLIIYIGRLTSKVLNLNARGWQALSARKRKCMPVLPNMRMLSILADDSTSTDMQLMLLQIPSICKNLTELHLLSGNMGHADMMPAALALLFTQLRLSVFELEPGFGFTASTSVPDKNASAWRDIKYCKTLKVLGLPAFGVHLAAMEIAELPQLQQLTVYSCPSADDIDDDTANGAGTQQTPETKQMMMMTTAIAALLAALLTQSSKSAPCCQIVALQLQCQLDRCLPQLLQRHAAQLCCLHKFAWHAPQLAVHYDAREGCIKWLPQQPQVARALLQFIASQAQSLRELDFTRNVHATPAFLASLRAKLQRPELTVWHDGCHKKTPDTSIDHFMRFHFATLAINKH